MFKIRNRTAEGCSPAGTHQQLPVCSLRRSHPDSVHPGPMRFRNHTNPSNLRRTLREKHKKTLNELLHMNAKPGRPGRGEPGEGTTEPLSASPRRVGSSSSASRNQHRAVAWVPATVPATPRCCRRLLHVRDPLRFLVAFRDVFLDPRQESMELVHRLRVCLLFEPELAHRDNLRAVNIGRPPAGFRCYETIRAPRAWTRASRGFQCEPTPRGTGHGTVLRLCASPRTKHLGLESLANEGRDAPKASPRAPSTTAFGVLAISLCELKVLQRQERNMTA